MGITINPLQSAPVPALLPGAFTFGLMFRAVPILPLKSPEPTNYVSGTVHSTLTHIVLTVVI